MCSELLCVVLVGYINVGKLMLFNVLIGVEVYVVDKLFVILDLIVCCIVVFGGNVVLVDIVGFVCDLLYELVVVFCVILSEVCEVDFLLYVVDVVDLYCEECIV